MDALTAQRTRLTFARVCIQVNADATYPEEILISIEEDVFSLKVQYEWKPSPCEHCKSLVHSSATCPSKPVTDTLNNSSAPSTSNAPRGRSKSRRPQGKTALSSIIPPSTLPSSVILSEHQPIVSKPATSTLLPPMVQNIPSTSSLPPSRIHERRIEVASSI
ncbi:uncharacterized protein LOC114578456 [Dendrobium catenatum]|uniref:uncharacterized protein LOC114578456 n=1 Tax=Dendrobium catenatum TaxID=906689 RepID=UPI00109EFA22|nr:uncharacterized protein LOC114578456 [Dendrobium catenatum]